MSEISSGMKMLRDDNCKPEAITEEGSTFYFRKLTLSGEEELNAIVEKMQDPTLRDVPKKPDANASEEQQSKWIDDMLAYNARAEKAFRVATAEIMRYVLTDSNGGNLFAPDDDIVSMLSNVYAKKFHRAYNTFRNGKGAGPAQAEGRFQS